LSEPTSISQLVASLDERYGGKFAPQPLHIFAVFSRVRPQDLRTVARREKVDLTVSPLSENFYDFSLGLRRRFVQGNLITSGKPWTILIRPSESSAVAGEVSRIALKHLYPDLGSAYVESEQLLDFLDQLSDQIGASSLQIRDYFLKSGKEGTTKRAWPRGERYIRKKIEEEMARKFLLDGISFSARSNTTVEARVARNGHFVLYGGEKGCYSVFNALIYQPLVKTAIRNRRLFEGRERRVVDGQPIVSPLKIEPGIDLGPGMLKDLRLTLMSNYSTAVIHEGNPWLLINAIDRKDGCYYDIYGYHDQIVVVPSEGASPEGLTRLYTTILDLFPSAKLQPFGAENAVAR